MMLPTIKARNIPRYILGLLAASVALTLFWINANLNYRYSASFSPDPVEADLLGKGAIAVEVYAVVATFLIAAAWVNRKYLWALVGSLTWVAAVGLSFIAAFSFQATTKSDHAAERGFVMVKLDSNKESLKEAQAELAFIPDHRPAEAILPEIESARSAKFFTATSGCTVEKTKKQRRFCEAFRRLRSEHASAIKAASLKTEIRDLQTKIEVTPAVYGGEDVGSAAVSNILGFSQDNVMTAMSLFIAALLSILAAITPKLAAACFKTPDLYTGKVEREETDTIAKAAPSAKARPVTHREPSAVDKLLTRTVENHHHTVQWLDPMMKITGPIKAAA